MSNIIRRPAAARFGNARGRVSMQVRVMVQQEDIAPDTFASYIEFLELVYGVKVQIAHKMCGTWITIPRADRTEAGVRVAGWLFGIDYILPRHLTTGSYDV